MTELRTASIRAAFAAFLLLALPLPLAGQAVEQQPAERAHVVRSGDTLWDLARTYLSDPFLWPEIFRLNAALVSDPARIYPNQRLALPGARAGTGDRLAWVTESPTPTRTVFYEGFQEARTAQQLPTVRAAGTFDVPVVTRGDFYRAGMLALPTEVRRIGDLTGSESPRTIRGALPPQISLYDRVLLTMAPGWEVLQPGARVQLIRQERRAGEHGWVWRSTGMATIADMRGNQATAVIVELFDVVSVGDLVMPAPTFPVPVGVAPQERGGLEGRVVAFEVDATLVPTQAIAFIDLGAASGLTEGDVFVAYVAATRDRLGRVTPAVDVAQLQVVRVLDRTSAVRVVSLEHPRLVAGMPVRLIAKMP